MIAIEDVSIVPVDSIRGYHAAPGVTDVIVIGASVIGHVRTVHGDVFEINFMAPGPISFTADMPGEQLKREIAFQINRAIEIYDNKLDADIPQD